MPALSYQKQFVPLVESGAKPHTIRAERKDGRVPAKIGDTLYQYTGMRTKACRKICEDICTAVDRLTITNIGGIYLNYELLISQEKFARDDGFYDLDTMIEWFKKTHGLPFRGWLIQWNPAQRGRKP